MFYFHKVVTGVVKWITINLVLTELTTQNLTHLIMLCVVVGIVTMNEGKCRLKNLYERKR